MHGRAVLAAGLAAAALLPASAPATVPPTDCGFVSAKGHRYNIKTHLVTCRRGRAWSKTYLATRKRPSGWSCQRYKDSALVFRCRRGSRDFFAIKRS